MQTQQQTSLEVQIIAALAALRAARNRAEVNPCFLTDVEDRQAALDALLEQRHRQATP
jgi:hypothetical protein